MGELRCVPVTEPAAVPLTATLWDDGEDRGLWDQRV